MIRVIKRNLNKKTLAEEKWNWHFAFFHFKNYKNVYINGKPLKPWYLLKNGDIIEIIEKPALSTGFWVGVVGLILKVGSFVAGHAAWIGAIGLTAAAGVVNNILTRSNANSTTQAKEYSSSTQPELRGASNDISNGCLPVVFGKIQQTPSYGQLPYRLVVDGASTNKYRQYFAANYNNVVYSDFKLGETPRTDYSIDYLDINGVKQPLSSSNTTVNGAEVTMHSPGDMNVADQLFYRPIGFTLPEKGKYTVRVRSADYADKTNFDIGSPTCAEIQFYVDGKVLDESILPKVNQIAFEATAYKGLSGTLKKFNYIAEARIPVWNGTDWNTVKGSENPAAIIRYLLTDKLVNPRAISPDLIDNESLVKLYNWCEEQGYKADGIVSEATKTMDVINEILSNCQGAMIPLLNGKHTFVIDGDEKIPKGMFNQHNSWDFTWSPNVGRLTEAIRASFTDSEDYTQDEVTVYWYDGAVHEEIKEGTTDADYLLIKKDLKYVTDRASVLKSIKYELLCTQTKRNNFEFSVNLEALNMTLLDRVYICNSSNMQNESTGLIKSVITENGNITGFEFYSDIEIPENAKIIIRSLDYETEQPVINIYDVLNTGYTNIAAVEAIPNNGIIKGAGEIQGLKDKWHYDGDLFTLGQDTIYDCVITDIKYNEDNTATLTARDY